jgi:hypothetical protein
MPRAKNCPLSPDTPVEKLWNISTTTAQWLNAVGIQVHQDLVTADLVDVWQQLKGAHRQVTRLMFFAMVGALHDCHWKEIPPSAVVEFDRRIGPKAKARKQRSPRRR